MDNKVVVDGSQISNVSGLQNLARHTVYYTYIFVYFLCAILVSIFTTTKSILRKMCPSKKDISKEIILITGGGSGLGRQIALELAKYQPSKIILWGRNIQSLSDTCDDITGLGVNCVYMSCDVGIKSKIDEQFEVVQRKHGPVSILINNAGIVFPGRLLELEDEEIETIYRVNLLAQFRMLQAFLPTMQKQQHGHIVTIGSCLGLMGINQTCAYASSKFGLSAYSESLAYMIGEGDYPGINTTMIYPFQINNKMFAGCSTRFPWMFPPIDEKETAVKTVNAILTNTTALIIPRHIYIVYVLHMLLPFSVDALISEFCGMPTAMDKFEGHYLKASAEQSQTFSEETENFT